MCDATNGRLPSVRSSCHSSQVTHWGHCRSMPTASHTPFVYVRVRQISVSAANRRDRCARHLHGRANAPYRAQPPSFAPLGAGGTAPYDPVFSSLRVLAAARGCVCTFRRRAGGFIAFLPPCSTSRLTLAGQELSTAPRVSCFLPRFHCARLGAFAAAAAELSPLPSPVGERDSLIKILLRQKKKAYVS